jgi:hypothetical protein
MPRLLLSLNYKVEEARR